MVGTTPPTITGSTPTQRVDFFRISSAWGRAPGRRAYPQRGDQSLWFLPQGKTMENPWKTHGNMSGKPWKPHVLFKENDLHMFFFRIYVSLAYTEYMEI